MKLCTKCQTERDESEFYKRSRTKDGLAPYCIPCQKAYDLAYRTAPANKERARVRAAKWLEDNRERGNERSRAWHYENRDEQNAKRLANREANIDRERATAAAYYRNNVASVRASVNAYRAANMERYRVLVRNRKAKVRAGGKHTVEEVMRLLEAQEHRCANPFCKVELMESNRQLDHVYPVSKGGSNTIENLSWLCGPCNLEKRAKTPEEWEQWLAFKYFL